MAKASRLGTRDKKVLGVVRLARGGKAYADLVPELQVISEEALELMDLAYFRALSAKAVDEVDIAVQYNKLKAMFEDLEDVMEDLLKDVDEEDVAEVQIKKVK